jgi:hypothetical protein
MSSEAGVYFTRLGVATQQFITVGAPSPSHVSAKVRVKVIITLRLTVYGQSVRLGAKPLGDPTRDFFNWTLAYIALMYYVMCYKLCTDPQRTPLLTVPMLLRAYLLLCEIDADRVKNTGSCVVIVRLPSRGHLWLSADTPQYCHVHMFVECVTLDEVWIDYWMYWLLVYTTRNYSLHMADTHRLVSSVYYSLH